MWIQGGMPQIRVVSRRGSNINPSDSVDQPPFGRGGSLMYDAGIVKPACDPLKAECAF